MKILNTSSIITSIAAVLLLTSCGPNSDDYDYTINEKVFLSAPETSFTVRQGQTINIPVVLERPIDKAATFKLEVLGGTPGDTDKSEEELGISAGIGSIPGDWGADFPGFEVEIPAYTTNYNIQLSALELLNASGEKPLILRLSEAGLRTALTQNDEGIVFQINVIPSENFISQLVWDGNYVDSAGNEHGFCDFDLDLLVYTSDFEGANFDAATGSCPEELSLEPGELPDGDYIIVADYFTGVSAETAPSAEFESIPARMIFSKPGAFVTTVDLSGIWDDFVTGSSSEGNSDGEATQVVANLNITNGVYTVTDPSTGEVLGQG